jgi:hypothetical protein
MAFYRRRKIYSTDPNCKFSFGKIDSIQALARSLLHIGTDIEYLELKSVPLVKRDDGRNIIDEQWFDDFLTTPALAKGYNTVGLHLTPKIRGKLMLHGSIRGLHYSDSDHIAEYYFVASDQKECDTRAGHEEGHNDAKWFPKEKLTTAMKRVGALHYYVLTGNLAGLYRELEIDPALSLVDRLKAQLELARLQLAKLLAMKKTLVQVCTEALGTDVTPDDVVRDEVACAVTVSTLIKKIDDAFPVIPGTWTLNEHFKAHAEWERVSEPTPGCIIISPTGTGKAGTSGHVGVVMEDGRIASNNSAGKDKGRITKNYTFASWTERFARKQGMPVLLYRNRSLLSN